MNQFSVYSTDVSFLDGQPPRPFVTESDALFHELCTLIDDLGKDGGIISPSIYDTAQVLRFHPPKDGIESTLEWLLSQQQADGGWGDSAFPLTRDMPTLAAILALATYSEPWQDSQAIDAGIRFLNGQTDYWGDELPDDLPVAAELIIPVLLRDAEEMQVPVPVEIYDSLRDLSSVRQNLIASMQPRAGTTAAFSWEAWGQEPDPAYLDELGSVGHSPSATAAWLKKARTVPGLAVECSAAEKYLMQAASATQSGRPNLYPTAWPIDRFEQAFGLYALLMAGLLKEPKLQEVIQAQLEAVQDGLKTKGIGFSDFFEPDGDNTAAVVAVLGASGNLEPLSMLEPYRRDEHFCSYPYELQPSLSVTARAIHAFRVSGAPTAQWVSSIVGSQEADGKWTGDKWNVSWVYTSVHMILACDHTDHHTTLRKAKQILLSHQYPDGSWGTNGYSSQFETCLAVIGLRYIVASDPDPQVQSALMDARRWMTEVEKQPAGPLHKLWLNKELYTVPRIERIFLLAARLLLNQDDDVQSTEYLESSSNLQAQEWLSQSSLLLQPA